MLIRPARSSDHRTIIDLNRQHVSVTSPMTQEKLETILESNALALVVEINSQTVGFLIGVREDSSYQNQNYRWFADRLKKFLYIDRVIISQDHQGSGVGRHLYNYLFDWAEKSKLHQIAAEMDILPPNEASLRFHKKMSFLPIGQRPLENGKIVSMQLSQINSRP